MKEKLNFKILSIAIVLLALPLTLAAVKTQQYLTQHAASPTGRLYTFSIYWGVSPSGLPSFSDLTTFETDAKKGVAIVNFFTLWGNTYPNFSASFMNQIRAHGSIPMITWQPDDPSNAAIEPTWTLASIISGTHDAYIKQFATDAKNWGHPFFLRFAHEMNGTWYPWDEGINTNKTGEYVAAWRHVHDVFTQVYQTPSIVPSNVTWVWSPNVEYGGSIPLDRLYPGPSYVDWVGMDGYNHGTANSYSPWQTFSTVFSSTYNHITSLAPNKPLMIGETASEESGGDKGAWLADAFGTKIPNTFPKIKAVILFNKKTGGWNWPIESSLNAQHAFANAICSNYYVTNQYNNLNTSPIPVAITTYQSQCPILPPTSTPTPASSPRFGVPSPTSSSKPNSACTTYTNHNVCNNNRQLCDQVGVTCSLFVTYANCKPQTNGVCGYTQPTCDSIARSKGYKGGGACILLGTCKAITRDGSGAILQPNPCGQGTNIVCCAFNN